MRFFCVADEDTVRGFRLAGIDARVVITPHQALRAIDKAISEPDCGIIILNERIASWIRPQIDRIRMEIDLPLIVDIPGTECPLGARKSLR